MRVVVFASSGRAAHGLSGVALSLGQADALRIPLHLNLAACKLKTKDAAAVRCPPPPLRKASSNKQAHNINVHIT